MIRGYFYPCRVVLLRTSSLSLSRSTAFLDNLTLSGGTSTQPVLVVLDPTRPDESIYYCAQRPPSSPVFCNNKQQQTTKKGFLRKSQGVPSPRGSQSQSTSLHSLLSLSFSLLSFFHSTPLDYRQTDRHTQNNGGRWQGTGERQADLESNRIESNQISASVFLRLFWIVLLVRLGENGNIDIDIDILFLYWYVVLCCVVL